MNPLDIIFGIIILGMAVRCALKGFIAEFMTAASVLGGIISGFLLFRVVASFMEHYVGPFYLSHVVAFLVVFLIVYLVIKLFENALYRLVDKINLENLDRALGLFLGLIEGVILVLLLIFILEVQPVADLTPLLQDSFLGSIGLRILPLFQEHLYRGDISV
ncbi:MAG: CvpA family protein [Spirochaetales bacterium]|nr:CvpA family protein [Spirochaetales bacterium]